MTRKRKAAPVVQQEPVKQAGMVVGEGHWVAGACPRILARLQQMRGTAVDLPPCINPPDTKLQQEEGGWHLHTQTTAGHVRIVATPHREEAIILAIRRQDGSGVRFWGQIFKKDDPEAIPWALEICSSP